MWVCELILCLEYLHAHSIVHRCIRPETLLINEHGHIRLIAFDFAKQVVPPRAAGEIAHTPLSQRGGRGGAGRPIGPWKNVHILWRARVHGSGDSPGRWVRECNAEAYDLSPRECARYSIAVDWWSLGVTCFELLNGFNPFCAPTPFLTYQQVIGDDSQRVL
jgi:protein kinase X